MTITMSKQKLLEHSDVNMYNYQIETSNKVRTDSLTCYIQNLYPVI